MYACDRFQVGRFGPETDPNAWIARQNEQLHASDPRIGTFTDENTGLTYTTCVAEVCVCARSCVCALCPFPWFTQAITPFPSVLLLFLSIAVRYCGQEKVKVYFYAKGSKWERMPRAWIRQVCRVFVFYFIYLFIYL